MFVYETQYATQLVGLFRYLESGGDARRDVEEIERLAERTRMGVRRADGVLIALHCVYRPRVITMTLGVSSTRR